MVLEAAGRGRVFELGLPNSSQGRKLGLLGWSEFCTGKLPRAGVYGVLRGGCEMKKDSEGC